MDKALFFDILKEFSRLNGIPAHVISDDKVIFTTLSEGMLQDGIIEFAETLNKEGVDIRIYNDIEYFAKISAQFNKRNVSIILGAAFRSHPLSIGYNGTLVSEMLIGREKMKRFLLTLPTVREEQFVGYVDLISRAVGGGFVTADMIEKRENPFRKQLEGKLTKYVFETRENEFNPYSPEAERKILDMVTSGDVEGCKRIDVSLKLNVSGMEVKYLFKIVALITLATRAVTESGVDSVQAYGLSDLYLTRLGNAQTDKQVEEIARSVLPQFAELAKKAGLQKDDEYSHHLIKATGYIKTHLHFPLSLTNVAEYCGISEKYLSRLFVKYKKEKFTSYVNRQRVLEAKELLVNTDMKLIDIAYSLSFVSESYFINVFEKNTGMTPQKYRNRYKL